MALALALWCRGESFGAEPRFVKVSDHCYYMQLKESGENVGAVITDDGILLINPPQEPELIAVAGSLANTSSKAVRWVVATEPGLFPNTGAHFYSERNPILLASAKMQALLPVESQNQAGDRAKPFSSSRFIFERQMRLFPSNLEVRIIAIQHKARTGGDIAIFVPAEKVLFAGGLYEAARYPDIDTAREGSAVGWIDGMKQIIDSVPVLKVAIPAAKRAPKTEPEKTIEEGITVISLRGEVSNLQNMKDLLESSRKLRNDISRSIRIGRTCSSFLNSSLSDPYRGYSNLESYAAQLFEALEGK